MKLCNTYYKIIFLIFVITDLIVTFFFSLPFYFLFRFIYKIINLLILIEQNLHILNISKIKMDNSLNSGLFINSLENNMNEKNLKNYYDSIIKNFDVHSINNKKN